MTHAQPQTSPPTEPVASLSHPLAAWLRTIMDSPPPFAFPRLIVIDDEENIFCALAAGLNVQRVFYTDDMLLSNLLRQALPPEATVHELSRRTGKKLFGTNRISRTFAVVRIDKVPALADLAGLERDLVVLEAPSIAGNVGAVVRTAVAFGVGGVVLLDTDLDSYDRRLFRASRGHVFSLPIVRATTAAFLDFCRRHDRPLLVTDPHAANTAGDVHTSRGGLALVFGSERTGCSPVLQKAATLRFKIPTARQVESLNVAAAAAITLFQRYGTAVGVNLSRPVLRHKGE